jgi:hypothetical protein
MPSDPVIPGTLGELLLGTALALPEPVFTDPWALLAHARTKHQEDRPGLADAYLRLAGQRPVLERESLMYAGKELFGYTLGTARQAIKQASGIAAGTSRTAPMVGTDEFLAEMVYRHGHEQPLGYLVHRFDRPEDPPAFVESIQTATLTYFPPNAGLLESGVILLPVTVEEYGDDEDLFIALRGYLSSFLQVEDRDYSTMMVCYVLMTWLYDRFNTVPYLRAQGDFQSGKSRLLQVIASVCYRPTLAGGATSTSPVFRIIDKFRGTLAIDEADFDRSELWQEIIKILNAGYQRGFPVLRSERSGDGEFDVKAYDCFGPKLLATRRRFNDEALESRCLTYVTPLIEELDARIPLELGAEFRAAAQQLRNKLLLWRFRKWATTTINPRARLTGVEPRANQIVQPMISCVDSERLRGVLVELVKKYSQRVAAERRDSLPGLVAQALLTRWAKSGRPPTLLLKTIVQELQSQHDISKISHRRVSDVVRGNLGLTTEQRGGYAHVFLTPDLVARLAQQYSFDLSTLAGPGAGGGMISP